MDEEKADGGEDGEELEEEEEEEETGTDDDAEPRRSLQFSESLPLTFAVCAAHDWGGGYRERTWWCHHSFFYDAASWVSLMV